MECREVETRDSDLGDRDGNLRTPFEMKKVKKTLEAPNTDKRKKAAKDEPNPKHKQAFEELLDLAMKPPKSGS